jgi:ATP-dependent Lhr-like helicase
MTDNPFHRLAPFIQEFIYRHSWTELRPVQVEACRVIFDTDSHLLLAAGTASGKTEAAFLPIITLLYEKPVSSVGALYIGPLKALINDQFVRLEDLLTEADIPVWHWHGDVSQAHKAKFAKDPRGILQITPESLESMLINRTGEIARIFSDLRFVVVDEVHAFMGSDRGRQVQCQIQRLSRLLGVQPRRIGLSATLGDYSLAEKWLSAGTDRPVATPKVGAGERRVRLAVEHFLIPRNEQSQDDQNGESEDAGQPRQMDEDISHYLFDNSKGRKCLIFTNSRGEAESVTAALRQVAQEQNFPDIYHVHHGSIAAPLREAAESAMRSPTTPAVTAATITLELGIDIGQLERIIQMSAPYSVSSFLQRLGRSGRRGNPAEMCFVCHENEPTGKETLPELTPWALLQCIAIIQLYLEEKWIEPIPPAKYPFSLLYHQTMSTLAACGELAPAALAERILPLAPFKSISKDDYAQFLRHLISIDHIQTTDERGLLIGLGGEAIVRNYRFYAVFADSDEYKVFDESKEIGSISMPPAPGERFGLAGRAWEVMDIDSKRHVVFAKPVKGRISASWAGGGGGDVHTRILQRMRQALLEDAVYPYLQPHAQARLSDARRMAKDAGIDKANLLSLGGNTYCLFPWAGSVPFRTLSRLLKHALADDLHVQGLEEHSPYYLTFTLTPEEVKYFYPALLDAVRECQDPVDLVLEDEAPLIQKYDEFVPPSLLRKAFAADYLSLDELKTVTAGWGPGRG